MPKRRKKVKFNWKGIFGGLLALVLASGLILGQYQVGQQTQVEQQAVGTGCETRTDEDDCKDCVGNRGESCYWNRTLDACKKHYDDSCPGGGGDSGDGDGGSDGGEDGGSGSSTEGKDGCKSKGGTCERVKDCVKNLGRLNQEGNCNQGVCCSKKNTTGGGSDGSGDGGSDKCKRDPDCKKDFVCRNNACVKIGGGGSDGGSDGGGDGSGSESKNGDGDGNNSCNKYCRDNRGTWCKTSNVKKPFDICSLDGQFFYGPNKEPCVKEEGKYVSVCCVFSCRKNHPLEPISKNGNGGNNKSIQNNGSKRPKRGLSYYVRYFNRRARFFDRAVEFFRTKFGGRFDFLNASEVR